MADGKLEDCRKSLMVPGQNLAPACTDLLTYLFGDLDETGTLGAERVATFKRLTAPGIDRSYFEILNGGRQNFLLNAFLTKFRILLAYKTGTLTPEEEQHLPGSFKAWPNDEPNPLMAKDLNGQLSIFNQLIPVITGPADPEIKYVLDELLLPNIRVTLGSFCPNFDREALDFRVPEETRPGWPALAVIPFPNAEPFYIPAEEIGREIIDIMGRLEEKAKKQAEVSKPLTQPK